MFAVDTVDAGILHSPHLRSFIIALHVSDTWQRIGVLDVTLNGQTFVRDYTFSSDAVDFKDHRKHHREDMERDLNEHKKYGRDVSEQVLHTSYLMYKPCIVVYNSSREVNTEKKTEVNIVPGTVDI